MIIFDLDGTLADCEHRRHFVQKPKCSVCDCDYRELSACTCEKWKPNWKAFFEECDKDKPILQTIEILNSLMFETPHRLYHEVAIWSGRCESVRDKTKKWLDKHLYHHDFKELKMRPIGDTTPDDQLKERWLNEYFHSGIKCCPLRWATHDQCCKKIEFVFDDRPKVVKMWRRRGIFCFDVNQTGEDF